jgi:opacity protein-like surface antigen
MVHSQSVKDWSVHISSGLSIPVGSKDFSNCYYTDTTQNLVLPSFPFSENWNSGFGIGFGIGYSLSPSLSVIVDVSYNSFHLDKSQILKTFNLSGDEYVEDSEMKSVSINGNVKYAFLQSSEVFEPYFVLGVGYMNVTSDDIAILTGANSYIACYFRNQNVINTSLGLGMDILGGESSSLFVEARFNLGYTEDKPFFFLPIRVGFRGSF